MVIWSEGSVWGGVNLTHIRSMRSEMKRMVHAPHQYKLSVSYQRYYEIVIYAIFFASVRSELISDMTVGVCFSDLKRARALHIFAA